MGQDPGVPKVSRATVHQNLTKEELAEQLSKAMADMAPKSALVLQLFYHEEMSLKEMSAVLGVSENAAKVQLHRARKQLRKIMLEESS